MGCGALNSARTRPVPPPKLASVVPLPESSKPSELTWPGDGNKSPNSSDTGGETKYPDEPQDRAGQEDNEEDDGEDDDEEDDESEDSYDGEPPEARWQRMARREERLARRRRRAAKAAKEGKSLPSSAPASIDCFRGPWRPHAQPSREGCFDRQCFLTHNRAAMEDVYELSVTLGKGTYGSVSRCRHRRTQAVRALKTISKKKVYKQSHLGQELEIMRILEHPNIAKLYETFEDNKHIYIVMELCTGGELFERIVNEGTSFQGFSETVVATLIRQIASAVYYMHLQQVAHRDLKPENFLLAGEVDNLEEACLKVIDFGFSARFEPGRYMTTCACTNHYVAPEVLDGKYTEACDVWSLGVVIYLLLCGSIPFYGSNEAQVLSKVKAGTYSFEPEVWDKVSQDAKDLVGCILVLDTHARHTAQKVMEHRWLEQAAPQAKDCPLSETVVNHFCSFHSLGKLKKAVLTMVAQQLPEASIFELRRIFEALDANGDGLLSAQDLQIAFQLVGMELPEALHTVTEHMDSDGSGMVEYTEFLTAAVDRKRHLQEDVCWAAFCVLDRNGDGKISKDEISVLLSCDSIATFETISGMDRADIEQVVADVDQDDDGMLNFAEFQGLLQNACSRKLLKSTLSSGLPGVANGPANELL